MSKTEKKKSRRDFAPARTPEARENQLISLAFDLAEEKLKDGSASSQLITHFLKLITTREQLENDRLRAELEVANAKVEHMKSQSTSKDLYEKALRAFCTYSGTNFEEEDDLENDE